MTAVYVVIAFFAGVMAALSFSVFINKKYSERDNESSDKQDILAAIESMNRISEKMSEDLNETNPSFRSNYDNLQKIKTFAQQYSQVCKEADEYKSLYRNSESELNKIKAFLLENKDIISEARQQANAASSQRSKAEKPAFIKPDDTKNIFNGDENKQPSAVGQTENIVTPTEIQSEIPAPTQPETPARNVFKMSDVFEIVEKLQGGNASYRVYNPSQNNFEYSNDVNSKFILYKCGDDIFVLPNQSSPFARKQVAEKVYKCNISFIDYEHSIIPCIVDNSGNILEQGEIF